MAGECLHPWFLNERDRSQAGFAASFLKSGDDGVARFHVGLLLELAREVLRHPDIVARTDDADTDSVEFRGEDVLAMRRRGHEAAVRAVGSLIEGDVLSADVEGGAGEGEALIEARLGAEFVGK